MSRAYQRDVRLAVHGRRNCKQSSKLQAANDERLICPTMMSRQRWNSVLAADFTPFSCRGYVLLYSFYLFITWRVIFIFLIIVPGIAPFICALLVIDTSARQAGRCWRREKGRTGEPQGCRSHARPPLASPLPYCRPFCLFFFVSATQRNPQQPPLVGHPFLRSLSTVSTEPQQLQTAILYRTPPNHNIIMGIPQKSTRTKTRRRTRRVPCRGSLSAS